MKEILDKTLDYLKIKVPSFRLHPYGKIRNFTCPYCKKDLAAHTIPGTSTCSCNQCKKSFGNIYDLVRDLEEDKSSWSDNQIIKYLGELFQIEVITEEDVEESLKLYQSYGFDLVPVQKGGKIPIEKNWPNQNHKDLEEWKKWLDQGLNIGVKTGKISNCSILDIDSKEIPPDISELLLGYEGFVQSSNKGFHYAFLADSDIPKFNFNLEFNGKTIHFDFQSEGGQVVIFPSEVDGKSRKILDKAPIPKMSEELKKFLLSYCKTVPTKLDMDPMEYIVTHPEEVTPEDPNLKLKNNNLEGCCNNTFIRLGGILRKQLNIQDTAFVMKVINRQLLESPMPNLTIDNMVGQISKYVKFEGMELANKILNYLKMVGEAEARDVKEVMNEPKAVVDKALSYLIKEGYVVRHRRSFVPIVKGEWKDTLCSVIDRVPFKVPYFNDIANFNFGDLILLGGTPKSGKCISNGYLLTNQGIIDISKYGQKKEEGKSNITKHFRIFSGEDKKNKSFRHPNYFWKEKIEKTIKITTGYGYEIEGTPDHRILVSKNNNVENHQVEFKKLKELKKEDKVIIATNNLNFSEPIRKKRIFFTYKKSKYAGNIKEKVLLPNNINETLGRFFGYIVGDGHLEKNCINIYQHINDQKNIEDISDIVKSFNLKPHIKIDGKMAHIQIFSCILQKLVSLKLFGIRNNKIANLKSPMRFIPDCILKSSKSVQVQFISALLNCESSKMKKNRQLEMTMSSEKLMKCLHVILLNFGIIGTLETKKVKKYPDNIYWRIRFSPEMTDKILSIFKPVKYKGWNIIKKFKRSYKLNIHWKNGTQQSTYYIDKIENINELNESKYVYDFNIESKKYKKNNQFWCNGFVNHNTTLSMNIVKRLKDQDIKPFYHSLEPGSRFSQTALDLGMGDGDFFWTLSADPTKIEFERNAVTIVDWLYFQDFAATNIVMKHFIDQLFKTNGFLIVFTQLKEDGSWFAPNLITNFPAFAARYIYDDDSGTCGRWKVDAIRDPKMKMKKSEIPCVYDYESKILNRVDELDGGIK